MDITFDPAKRARTLAERGLDFADAGPLFEGPIATEVDGRREYGEPRFRTAAILHDRVVVIIWTPRDGTRRIISMRHAHVDEQTRWRDRLGRS